MHILSCSNCDTQHSTNKDTVYCIRCDAKLSLPTLEECLKPVFGLAVDTTLPVNVNIYYEEV